MRVFRRVGRHSRLGSTEQARKLEGKEQHVRIGILGTGIVAPTLAPALAERGHEVMVGTRDPEQTLARTDPDMYGRPPFRVWHEEHSDIALGTFAESAAHGEVVVNAINGGASMDGLRAAGEESLAGKALLDVSNPLDFSHGMPPSLLVCNTDSLAEQIQRAFPATKVVKSLNTMNASVMVDPGGLGDGDHTVFVSGNDAGAKSTVVELLRSLGWTDIIDLGDLTTARGAEMVLPIWVSIFGALETPQSNIKIVR
jgi:8-hydroxy-5-deazaflavin:NADPH oxidoreductase